MKQQLLQSREQLLNHLEQKINDLKRQRQQLLDPAITAPPQHPERTNLRQYLQQQANETQGNPISKNKVTRNNFVAPQLEEPIRTKADIFKEQQQTKQKLQILGDLYHKKRELESIGIYQRDSRKISSLYSRKDTRNKINKKLAETQKKQESKAAKDKIIREEMQKVEKFLQQSTQGSRKTKQLPQNHYSKLILDQRKRTVYESLLNKPKLTPVEKQRLLEQTFAILNPSLEQVDKDKLKAFLLSNPDFCHKFHISKPEIMRDLAVYSTTTEGALTFQEFYEFVVSIEITNKALKPNLGFKFSDQKQVAVNPKTANGVKEEQQRDKQMQKYLKSLFVYFDSKNERIIEREKYELALKKGALFDDKKYRYLKKSAIIAFGEALQVRRKHINPQYYYKTLDLKFIGLQQVIQIYNQTKRAKFVEQQQDNVQNQSVPEYDQNYEEQDNFTQEEFEQAPSLSQEMPNQKLQPGDFQKYGWKIANDERGFAKLQEVDKYYREVNQKYGNEIHWNGFEQYQQDFTKLNQMIKQMNAQHSQ